VKTLIKDTYDKLNKERIQPFMFRNQNMGDMLDLVGEWWDELKGGSHVNADEVLMKDFLEFALKKKIIVDEKELDTLFKDLNGNAALVNATLIKSSEFFRIFSRPCFRGQLQNLYDYIDKSTIIMKS
jgi:hypothetical protein